MGDPTFFAPEDECECPVNLTIQGFHLSECELLTQENREGGLASLVARVAPSGSMTETGQSNYRLDFELAGLPKPTNAIGTNRYVVNNERKQWHTSVGLMCMGRLPEKPLRHARLTLVRHSSQAPDADGLVSSFKAVVDGLVLAGVLEDDSMEHIGMPEYAWEKAPPKHGKIRVLVEG